MHAKDFDYLLDESVDLRKPQLPRGFQKLPYRLTNMRYFALIIMNLVLFGYLAVFDCPQPLEKAMKDTLGISEQAYDKLYTFLAIPNIFLPIFAGMLVDRMGVRPSLLFFGFLVFAGQALLAYGGYLLNFNVMLIGRVLYSLGADPLNIAQVVMINKWFKGKELALAISLGTLMAGGGKAFNSILVPLIYDEYHNLWAPLGFGAFICLLSLVCIFVMIVWDKANDNLELAMNPKFGAEAGSGEHFSFSDLKKFKFIVWLLVFNYGIFDGTIFTLRAILNEFYQDNYNYTAAKAGQMISLHYIVMAISSPIMGKMVDKIGKRASITLFTSFLGVLGFAYYIMVPTLPAGSQGLGPYIPLVLFGLYMGLDDAAVFASLPLVLDEKYLGTGYGLYYVVENLVLTGLPMITGEISERYEALGDPVTGYWWISVILGGMAVLGSIESLVLWIEDKRTGSVLDKTVAKSDDEFVPANQSADGTDISDAEKAMTKHQPTY
jgi:MFS family permease